MKYLLDTCAVIWAVSSPEKLTPTQRSALEAPSSEIYFSPISAGELACLVERNRISLDRHWKTWFNHFTSLNGWRSLDITLEIMQEAYSLPETFHPDPADRIITATARIHRIPIITADKKLIDYPHVESV